jgi:hypothetical protein
MKNKIFFLTLSLLWVVLYGCDLLNLSPSGHRISDGEEIKIFYSEDIPAFPIDPATVEKADIKRHRLYLTVSYGGGCTDHIFELYGLGYFQESNPPIASIYLSHNANGDMCEAWITRELVFDLTPLKQTYTKFYRSRRGEFYLRIIEPRTGSTYTPMPLYRF